MGKHIWHIWLAQFLIIKTVIAQIHPSLLNPLLSVPTLCPNLQATGLANLQLQSLLQANGIPILSPKHSISLIPPQINTVAPILSPFRPNIYDSPPLNTDITVLNNLAIALQLLAFSNILNAPPPTLPAPILNDMNPALNMMHPLLTSQSALLTAEEALQILSSHLPKPEISLTVAPTVVPELPALPVAPISAPCSAQLAYDAVTQLPASLPPSPQYPPFPTNPAPVPVPVQASVNPSPTYNQYPLVPPAPSSKPVASATPAPTPYPYAQYYSQPSNAYSPQSYTPVSGTAQPYPYSTQSYTPSYPSQTYSPTNEPYASMTQATVSSYEYTSPPKEPRVALPVPECYSPVEPQKAPSVMPNAKFLGSSNFVDSSLSMPSLSGNGLASPLSPRISMSLMSPYEAIGPEPTVSMYGSLPHDIGSSFSSSGKDLFSI